MEHKEVPPSFEIEQNAEGLTVKVYKPEDGGYFYYHIENKRNYKCVPFRDIARAGHGQDRPPLRMPVISFARKITATC